METLLAAAKEFILVITLSVGGSDITMGIGGFYSKFMCKDATAAHIQKYQNRVFIEGYRATLKKAECVESTSFDIKG